MKTSTVNAKKKSRLNAFCEVEFLNGKTAVYQFPNDLRGGMITSYKERQLGKILENALINVPVTTYDKKGFAKLRVARITKVFVKKYSQQFRTRGQFLTHDNWSKRLDASTIKFLLHDHALSNKFRIGFDLFCWKMKNIFAKKRRS